MPLATQPFLIVPANPDTQVQQRQQQEIERKKAALAVEMEIMRRKIAVQELRQAGKPVPPVRIVQGTMF